MGTPGSSRWNLRATVLRWHRNVLSFALIALTSGCMHFNVTEDVWLHPGYATMAPKAMEKLTNGTGYAARSVAFSGSDGVQLNGLLATRPGNRIAVLYLGGDSFQTGYGGLEVGRTLESLGVDFLLVDYRGYGGSEGIPTLDLLNADALAAYDFLHTQPGLEGSAIVVHGFSMGSMIAPYLATSRPISGLVLESTATTVTDWADNAVPWYGWPFVQISVAKSLQEVSNVRRLQTYRGPLFLAVGADDGITPPKFSHKLYQESRTPDSMKMIYVARGRDHGETFEDAGALAQYSRFLNSIVLKNPASAAAGFRPD